jgi:hypothetical protein
MANKEEKGWFVEAQKWTQHKGQKKKSSIRTFLGHTLMVPLKGIPQKEVWRNLVSLLKSQYSLQSWDREGN